MWVTWRQDMTCWTSLSLLLEISRYYSTLYSRMNTIKYISKN